MRPTLQVSTSFVEEDEEVEPRLAVSKTTVFGLTEASRVRCSVKFADIFEGSCGTRAVLFSRVLTLHSATKHICAATRYHLQYGNFKEHFPVMQILRF